MLTAIVAWATSLPCPFSHQFKSWCGCRIVFSGLGKNYRVFLIIGKMQIGNAL